MKMIQMSEKQKVVFKNRYGGDITFLVRKRKKQPKPEPVVSIKQPEEILDYLSEKLGWSSDEAMNDWEKFKRELLIAVEKQAGVQERWLTY